MVKLKSLLKEWNDTTSFKTLPKRWSKNFNNTKDGLTELERKEGVANPITQKYDFSKPTVVHLSKEDMQMLHRQGRVETDGLTIIYEQ